MCSFFNYTATPDIYTLSLHDALPISRAALRLGRLGRSRRLRPRARQRQAGRSEEHTSELQSRVDLVCRLLLEKKKKAIRITKQVFTVHWEAMLVPAHILTLLVTCIGY